jgi:hypothetical protein
VFFSSDVWELSGQGEFAELAGVNAFSSSEAKQRWSNSQKRSGLK